MNSIFRLITLIGVGFAAALPSSASMNPADSLVIRFANRTRMVIYAPDKAGIQALTNYDLNKIVREMSMELDSVPGGETAILRSGDRYIKDTVLVVTKKKNGVTIVINGSGDTTRVDSSDNHREYRVSKRKRGDSHGFDYTLSIGLNSFLEQSSSSAYPESSYLLRPIGSRYIALAMGALPTIARGKWASLKLYYGVEVAWNNFMFDGNIIPERTPAGGIMFTDAGRELQKSKLTVCTIGIPVVPRVTFYNSEGRRVGHIGLGGYVNYRIDSYRKIKEADGSKDRRHSNFDLATYRYGLMAHLGLRSANFFVKYDLSPLFVAGKGPDVRVLTFGIGL